MIPGQLIAPGQLTDPGVNFASVHGLTPVTVHMSFSLPRSNFERRVTRCTTPGNPPCRGNFSRCEQNAKVAPGRVCFVNLIGIPFGRECGSFCCRHSMIVINKKPFSFKFKAANRYVFCVVHEKKLSLINIVDAVSPLKSQNELIAFCCRQPQSTTVFSQLLMTTLTTHGKIQGR